MKRSRKLHDLIKLAELKKAMALDRLSTIQRRQTYIHEQLRCIDNKREELCSFVASHSSDGVQAEKYHEWLSTKRHDLESDWVMLKPEYDQTSAAANKAFGRAQALRELHATMIEKK